jgi:hypothetical protein
LRRRQLQLAVERKGGRVDRFDCDECRIGGLIGSGGGEHGGHHGPIDAVRLQLFESVGLLLEDRLVRIDAQVGGEPRSGIARQRATRDIGGAAYAGDSRNADSHGERDQSRSGARVSEVSPG